jgi:starvation-inducible DNA-binding protein
MRDLVGPLSGISPRRYDPSRVNRVLNCHLFVTECILFTEYSKHLKKEEAAMENAAIRTKPSTQGPTEPAADLGQQAVDDISTGLRRLLADVFALYVKTKNFHWHMTGPNFRDYHLLLDEHATQIFEMTDDIAERARKLGGTTIRSISDISKHQRLKDSNQELVPPIEMLHELCRDNRELTRFLRSMHEVCENYNDVATASMIEVWLDQTERRAWFLGEITGDRKEAKRESQKAAGQGAK